jgi:hypothetical protein
MKPLKAVALLLVFLASLAMAQAKTKKPDKLPAVVNLARYVYVEAVEGQQFDLRLPPEDRQAIADVNAAFQDWSRYVLTTRRDQADLIIVVRKGRLAEGNVGVSGGTGPKGAPGQPTGGTGYGVAYGGEVGSPDDLFEVFMPNPNDVHGTPIWMRTKADGLDAPKVVLFQDFKAAVERDYPPQTASQPHKP